MNPSSHLRLKSMMRALSECIMPAIREDAPLAREQAGLVMAHLSAMLEQGTREQRVQTREASLLRDLADKLSSLSQSEAALEDEHRALQAARDSGGRVDLSFAVERLLANSQASAEFKTQAKALTLTFARSHTLLGRAWFKPMGFDSDPAALPSVDALLETAGKSP